MFFSLFLLAYAPLAKANYNVYKSIPYGPLLEVLPYFSRRAAENRAVLSGARKERQLLKAELRRRIRLSMGLIE